MHTTLLSLLIANAAGAATLTGVVADRDIYHGERLVGATVWLDDGTTMSSNASGYYTFEGLSTGTYTAHAIADGFLEGSCTKTIDSDDTYWCSIALEPDPGGDDTGDPPDDTGPGPGDTQLPDDTDPPVADTAAPGSFPPGAWVPLYGCSAAKVLPAAWLALLAGLGLTVRRRRA